MIRYPAFVFWYNSNKHLWPMNNRFPWMYLYEYRCLSYFKNEKFILKIERYMTKSRLLLDTNGVDNLSISDTLARSSKIGCSSGYL